jgi:hypothetical protein
MKRFLLPIILAALAPASAFGTIVTAAGGGPTGWEFYTSTGELLSPTNASVAVGRMEGSSFIEFAPDDPTPITFVTGTFAGQWTGFITDNSGAANAFDGQSIWFRIEADVSPGFSGVAYFSGALLFPVNNGGVGDQVVYNANALTTVGAESTAGSIIDSANGRIVVGVPEASSLSLAGLALLGMLRRKR